MLLYSVLWSIPALQSTRLVLLNIVEAFFISTIAAGLLQHGFGSATRDSLIADPLNVVSVTSRNWNEYHVEFVVSSCRLHSFQQVLGTIFMRDHNYLVLAILDDDLSTLDVRLGQWLLECSNISNNVFLEQIGDNVISHSLISDRHVSHKNIGSAIHPNVAEFRCELSSTGLKSSLEVSSLVSSSKFSGKNSLFMCFLSSFLLSLLSLFLFF